MTSAATSSPLSHDSEASRGPTIHIRPTSGWAALNLVEVFQFRDLAVTLGARDLKLRYKQTMLGVIWVILLPLIGAAIFTFVFSRVADIQAPGGAPYFLFAFTGMWAWNLFSKTWVNSGNSMVGNAHLVQKIYFPRLVLPFSSAFSTLVDFCVAGVLMAIIMVIYGVTPGIEILFMPVCLLLLLMLSLGLGMMAASVSIRYRDVKHLLTVFVQLLLYISPVAYPAEAVQEKVPDWAFTLYQLNPLSPLLQGFRASVLGVGEVNMLWFAYGATVAVTCFVVGALLFKRMERTFADVI